MADKDIPSLLFEEDKVKIAVIGDAEIGKTCLLMAYRPDNSSLVPSIFNSIIINKTVTINDIEHALDIELCDTGSTIEDKKMRIKSYKNVDIILLCFDVINRETLTNINNIWLPEIHQFASNAILSLIGLKGDLRANKNTNKDDLIPTDDINTFQTNNDQIFNYIETSALRKKNVELAFESAIQQFFTLNLKHRKTTDIAEIDSPAATDIVGTHAKQWSQHLREFGNNNDDPFAQYKHIAQQQSQSSLNMNNNGQQPAYNQQPSYNGQLSVNQVPGSFAGPYSMGQQSMVMGGGGMSYQSQNNAFMNGSVAGSYQSQMSFANGYNANGMLGGRPPSQISLIGLPLAENREVNPSVVPPPPQQPHPDNIKKIEDSPNEAIALKESNVSKDSIPTYKLSEDDDPERTGSIDYGSTGKDRKQGGCCVVL